MTKTEEYLPEGWRFGTDGIRGKVASKMQPVFMTTVAMAAGKVLKEEGVEEILIGKDTRISGYMIESALQAGFISSGINVVLLGPVPTPAVSFLTALRKENAFGLVISASHNTYLDNGIKFFNSKGEKISSSLEKRIENYILRLQQWNKDFLINDANTLGKASRLIEAQDLYIEFCKSKTPDLDLSGRKIVLDAANGANYKIAPKVFEDLGAETIKIACEPNGININESCGSTNPENLSKSVIENKADFGIAFDGDGDRLSMVDSKGRVLDGDDLMYLFLQNEENLDRFRNGDGVVGTHMTNLSLEKYLRNNGINFFRSDIGDKYVHTELEKRGWTFGGESSGHLMFLDEVSSGDALVASLKILDSIKDQDFRIDDLVDGFVKFPQFMVNIEVKDPNLCLLDQKFIEALSKNEKILNDSGRILIRPSGTEPVLRIMAEAENKDLVEEIVNDLAESTKNII